MRSKTRSLSAPEAAMLICGSGLGTGILAVPYLVAQMGLVPAILCVAVACGVSMVSHLMVADLALHSHNSVQLLGIFEQHLFVGRHKKAFSNAFFVVLVVMLLLNLTLYITCAAEAVSDAFGWPMPLAKVVFYFVASAVVALGVKSIGVSEKYAMLAIGAVVVALGLLSLPKADNPLPLFGGSLALAAALYSMCMFSFSALFSVPQVVNYIGDKSKIRRCVFCGIGANALLTVGFAVITGMASGKVTRVATVGLSARHGMAATVLSTVFVVLAMLTSFLSIALAQIDVIKEKTRLPGMAAWGLATLPTLAAALLLPLGYLSYIEIVGGVFAIIVVAMILPAYRRAVKGAEGPLLLGRAGRERWLMVLIAAFYLLMAAGSFLPTG